MYNPFVKGDYPVGVRTMKLEGNIADPQEFTTEIWYPATDRYQGQEAIDRFKFVDEMPETSQEATRDAEAADGKRPLIMYWHGGYGHRRELAAMCVFLASHGFVVAAPDFPGDHIAHTFGSDPLIKHKPVDESAKARPQQAAEMIERIVTSSDPFLSSIVDGSRVGSFGLSLGGFTTLAVNSESTRLKASVAIAPASGKRSPVPGMERISRLLDVDNWKSNASTFLLTGELDSFVILEDVRELFARLRGEKRLAVLNRGGHIHWADNAELVHESLRQRYASGEFPDPELDGPAMAIAMRPFGELCPAEHGQTTMRGIAVAHFDATLNQRAEAKSFLADDLAGTFAQRGIDVEVSEKQESAGV